MRVAFQGELGAFSQQAILQLLGPKAVPIPHQRFDEAFAAVDSGKVDAAVIPLENTLAGSVHENYDLLLKYSLEITAETSVRVIHNLIAPPGVSLRALRTVYSHPVALNQCLDFFASHPRIQRTPFYDTAGSVKMIMEQRPTDAGAIASELAAEIYGAHILKRGIEDDRQNFTRFFLLEPAGAQPRAVRGAAEASLEDFAGIFHSQHSRGVVPLHRHAGLAGCQSGEDRIAPAARQALGVFVLSGLMGPSRRQGGAQRAGPLGRAGGFSAGIGKLSRRVSFQ